MLTGCQLLGTGHTDNCPSQQCGPKSRTRVQRESSSVLQQDGSAELRMNACVCQQAEAEVPATESRAATKGKACQHAGLSGAASEITFLATVLHALCRLLSLLSPVRRSNLSNTAASPEYSSGPGI